ncbi:uncharacterized protein C2845_PM13G25680 [Panicum miliaceum]|uniref:Uncharacterized protein n=1 Tax=Panicum miliaceum TaxID=4540 RepID=A0A3L6RMJ9_PANMI|nr:uncharacterized protein C2845_PM13G25680 [Panicum miliaceum]
MATAWVRSLSCRSSYAVTDAAVAPSPAKKPSPLPFSCATAAAADVMDAVAYAQQARRKKIGRERDRRREPRPRPKKKPKPMAKEVAGALFMPSPAPGPPVTSAFLTMAELPEGHSSRRVVELNFASRWGGASGAPEPSVEALFHVHSASRAVARFEEARAAAGAQGADGNEIMRFQCRAPADAPGGVFGAGVATCRLGASASAVRTFACSGAAHASVAGACGGAASGRRAMLVCRVIAGRVPAAEHPGRPARSSSWGWGARGLRVAPPVDRRRGGGGGGTPTSDVGGEEEREEREKEEVVGSTSGKGKMVFPHDI